MLDFCKARGGPRNETQSQCEQPVSKFALDILKVQCYIYNMMNDLDNLKEAVAMESFGRSRTLCLAGNQCVKCGTYDLTFRDELSRKEYQLTVWCQSCQDEFFGV